MGGETEAPWRRVPTVEGETHGRSTLGCRGHVCWVYVGVCEIEGCLVKRQAVGSCVGPSHLLLPFGSELSTRRFPGFLPTAPSLGLKARMADPPAGCPADWPSSPSPTHHPFPSLPLPFLPCLALWLAYGSHFYLSTAPGCCSVPCSSERDPQIPRRAISEAACEAASCLQGASGPVTSA